MNEVETFARIKNVPVFRAGTHNGLTFSEADIDEMIASSNEALPFIMESIQAGAYRDNPQLQGVKSIPALLNLGHSRFLSESLKELVKDVSIKFQKQGDWITATFDGVKSDIAHFLRERFPLRSVEIIPSLFNPLTGRTHKNVIRSVAFLPGDIPPAVKGQTPELAIEFAETPIVTAVSRFEEEKQTMPDELKIEEQQAQAAEMAELTAQIKAFEDRLTRAENEKAALETRLNAAETKNKAADINMFCAKLAHEYGASPAFLGKMKPLFMQESNGVITFGASEELLKGFVEWVVKNADAIAVAIGEKAAPDPNADPAAKKTPQEMRDLAVAAMAQERGLSLPEHYNEVWRFAAEKDPKLFG